MATDYANYPKESLKRGEEGKVGFTVDISETGSPLNCRVTLSSGYPRLDAATCDQVEKYMHFKPASDPNGKAIKSEYSGNLKWVIPKK
jgi:periplasmic protein TonB